MQWLCICVGLAAVGGAGCSARRSDFGNWSIRHSVSVRERGVGRACPDAREWELEGARVRPLHLAGRRAPWPPLVEVAARPNRVRFREWIQWNAGGADVILVRLSTDTPFGGRNSTMLRWPPHPTSTLLAALRAACLLLLTFSVTADSGKRSQGWLNSTSAAERPPTRLLFHLSSS